MKRALIALALAGGVLAAGTAAAQTATQPAPAQTTAPASGSSTEGAFDKLSPGNQKIVRALYDAQQQQPASGTTAATKPLTLNQIAAMKDRTGWGNAFKQMKEQGLVQEKNLGEVVSKHSRQRSGGTTVTTGSGRSYSAGKGSSQDGASGKGEPGSRGEAGTSGGGSARGGNPGHGGGRGK